MLSSPLGPLIETSGEAPSLRSARPIFDRLIGGCVIVNVTSGGMERGVRPICEGRLSVVEKVRAEMLEHGFEVEEEVRTWRRRRHWRGCNRSITNLVAGTRRQCFRSFVHGIRDGAAKPRPRNFTS